MQVSGVQLELVAKELIMLLGLLYKSAIIWGLQYLLHWTAVIFQGQQKLMGWIWWEMEYETFKKMIIFRHLHENFSTDCCEADFKYPINLTITECIA